ncbi:alanine racemase [Staphylococcus haemolyticus]|uniref:Alanine racemase n=1 Tax=Staphylococcus haemolyticus TaxID=1283 RepID=A0AB38PBI6_STAHA|nr:MULTISPECIES: alanine racemase [Staphylococcus]MCE4964543.1 alanine racemase [Staphylococcus haemolyticus]MCE4988417.1 alanine racemase [Staphylococcus haemolyticus]MCE4992870.1 alanine racemase [Staphylococcus haemolyticus]MCE5051110.1 alanine racemase [Staphylococcus haemolyticus]PTK39934.1 alanine racemase [Staphylococcus haemolyticus]
MSDKFYRSTYLNVDLSAILNNYNTVRTLHSDKTVIPVVKANSYGLGSVKIAQHLMNNGADFFAVATLDEAIELRMHGINAQILILGVIPLEDINKAIQHRVALTVPSLQWLQHAIELIRDDNEKNLWLHVKLDTGMGRLGIKSLEEYKEVIDLIQSHPHLVFEGVYTHFANADEPGDSMDNQYEQFETLVTQAEKPKFIHSQNSAGSLLRNFELCNAVRLGISLYGYYPSAYVKEKVETELQPSAQLLTQVVQTKYLKVGESVSYGSTYTATEDIKIAILPIGYADGYLRSMQGAFVNVKGHQCEVIGRVCMDQMIIKVPDDVKERDTVTLLDNAYDSPQSAETLAQKQDTISYEVLCNLGRRLPRIYQVDDEMHVTNELLK